MKEAIHTTCAFIHDTYICTHKHTQSNGNKDSTVMT